MSTTPRVLHLVLSLAYGGLEKLVVEWTNERNRRFPGSTVVCCLDQAGALAREVQDGSVVVLNADRSKAPFDFRVVRALRHRLGDFQVIHSHNLAAQQYAALAALGLRRVRHVHTEHGSNPHMGGWKNRIRLQWLWRVTDCVVAVSRSTAEELAVGAGFPLRRITVIANGVRVRGDRSALRDDNERDVFERKFGLAPHTPVLGSVGRLAYIKGYDRLLRAFAGIMRQGTFAGRPPVLLLVGDGPERASLEALARELGICPQVVFAGYQMDPYPLLNGMHLFVLPSRSEGLPVALLEAMMACVPVVVTDVGENRRVIEDGRYGRLLPDDERQWPDVLRETLDRAGEQNEQLQRARDRVIVEYSLDHTLGLYEQVYAG